MWVEACLFLHCVVVEVATNPFEHPLRMLHDLPLKLVVARVSPPLLECHKQQEKVKKKIKTYNLRNHCVWLSKQTTLLHPKHVTITLNSPLDPITTTNPPRS